MTGTITEARWWRESHTDTGHKPLLLTFPYAGGGASLYRTWPELLADTFHVVAVQLPGREQRIEEAPQFGIAQVAREVAGRVGTRPYAVFGHSMGGRLAFEVASTLQRTGGPTPGLVVVSGARPPHVVANGPLDRVSLLTDQRLVSRLRRSGSVPDMVLDEPELLELFLPTLRSDFGWVEQMIDHQSQPIDVPMLVLSGTHDVVADLDQMSEWARWTTASCTDAVVAGDHFFLDAQPRLVTEQVARVWSQLTPTGTHSQGAEQTAPLGRRAHHVTVGGGPAWNEGLVRTTMLPAESLELLNRPDLAELADEALAAGAGTAACNRLTEALADPTPAIARVASDPLFREALAWQNPAVIETADRLADQGRPISRRARREAAVARYWQRYAAKNETIGFFGPTLWASVNPDQPHTTVTPGQGLCRDRVVAFEGWAVRAMADVLLDDWEIRARQAPHLSALMRFDLASGTMQQPPRPPLALSAERLAVIRSVNGTRLAGKLAAHSGLAPDVLRHTLRELTDENVVRWPGQVAPGPGAQEAFAEVLDNLPDVPAAAAARAAWNDMLKLRGDLAAAAGDADAVMAAGERLDAAFRSITDAASSRASGQMYVGRRVFYEDTSRDADVVLGADVLEPLDDVVPSLRRAARWFVAELADRHAAALADLCDELVDDQGAVDVQELFFLAVGMLFGPEAATAHEVTQEFADRWSRVLDVPTTAVDEPVPDLELSPEAFGAAVERHFPERRTSWTSARIHSPDIQVVAPSLEAIHRGELRLVLGEMHAAWATLDVAAVLAFHPDPQRLREQLTSDTGDRRARMAFPPSWPRATTRTRQVLKAANDAEVIWAEDAGADAEREVAVTDLVATRETTGWRVRSRSGHPHVPSDGWSLPETFGDMLSVHAVDGFKLMAAGPQIPRVTVGRVVLLRRTWRLPLAETGLLLRPDTPAARFLAGRALRGRLGLPEQVYVGVPGETKPVYCDWRSPAYVHSLLTMLRSAAERRGTSATVSFSEALPSPDEAWFPDASGRTYLSEIRLQLVDEEVGNE